MSRIDRTCVAIAGLSLLFGAACGVPIGRMPALTVRAPDASPALDDDVGRARFERLVAIARSLGYDVTPLQPSRLRFGARTRHTDNSVEDYGPYRVAVECYRGASACALTPLGPRVEPVPGGYELPEAMRVELEQLAAAMQRDLSSER